MNKIKSSFVPGILCVIVTTVLLCIPGRMLPEKRWFNIVHLDKIVHICIFCTMFLLWLWPSIRNNARNYPIGKIILIIAACQAIYGVGMEFIQHYFVPNRSFELADMLADAGGILAGILFSAVPKK